MHGEPMPSATPGASALSDLIMVTTLAPAGIAAGWSDSLASDRSRRRKSHFQGGLDWLRSLGVRVVDLDSDECASLLTSTSGPIPRCGTRTLGKNKETK